MTPPTPPLFSPDDSLSTPPPTAGDGSPASPADSAPSTPGRLLRAGELAARMGVSRQTVNNWVGLDPGMPVATRDANGWPLFDENACRRWRAAYRPLTGHGGPRPGGGRPPSNRGQDPLASMREAARESSGAGDTAAPAVTARQLRAFLEDPSGSPLSLLGGRAIKEQYLAAKAVAEVAKLRGEMVAREDAEEAWGLALAAFGRALDAMPPRVVPRLVHAAAMAYASSSTGESGADQAGIARALAAEFEQILREEVETVRGAIVADPLSSEAAAAAA